MVLPISKEGWEPGNLPAKLYQNKQMEIINVRWGLFSSVLAIVLGFLLGAVFGAFEDNIKDKLKANGESVFEEIYQGDSEMMNKTVNKSWSYVKRAHMHWGGIGAAGVALILVLNLLSYSVRVKRYGSLIIGLGSVMYPLFWLMAAFRAPSLGSTSAAKESLNWLAVPGAAFLLIGVILVAVGLLIKFKD